MLRPFDASLISRQELAYYRRVADKFAPFRGDTHAGGELPAEAVFYLRCDNPRLIELRNRYRNFVSPGCTYAVWNDELVARIDLQYFRGDNPYVWQFQDLNSEMAHILTAEHLQAADPLGLLDKLQEDNLFGVYAFWFEERLVSRDLLDSINEINFLEETLGISRKSDWNLLDIGAGYGRLAHRLVRALPSLGKIYTTDSIAHSTFISEFYLQFRGVDDKAQVVPFDEIQDQLSRTRIDCAISVYSFCECTYSSVCWWLDLLKLHEVRYLMIVTDSSGDVGTRLVATDGKGVANSDYLPALEERGYRRIGMRSKFTDPTLRKHGISNEAFYHLFELRGA